jgi:hypothetical protein
MSYAESLDAKLREARELAKALADKEKGESKIRFDVDKEDVDFQVDDLVLLNFPLRKVGQSDKLQKRYFGPFRILERKGPVTFKVRAEPAADLPGPRCRTQVVNVARLKPFIPRSNEEDESEGLVMEPDEERQDRTEPEEAADTGFPTPRRYPKRQTRRPERLSPG